MTQPLNPIVGTAFDPNYVSQIPTTEAEQARLKRAAINQQNATVGNDKRLQAWHESAGGAGRTENRRSAP